MDDPQVLCASRLRMARAELNLSQNAVAEKAGISPHTLLNMESGLKPINAQKLALVAAVYGKPVEWFYGDDAVRVRELSGEIHRAATLPLEAIDEIIAAILEIKRKYTRP